MHIRASSFVELSWAGQKFWPEQENVFLKTFTLICDLDYGAVVMESERNTPSSDETYVYRVPLNYFSELLHDQKLWDGQDKVYRWTETAP